MSNHPINELLEKAMENLKKMVEVNTVIGDAVETKNGTVIIPVTKVSYGFAAGGSDFSPQKSNPEVLPFGGGSGGGISIQPIGFLLVKDKDIRFQIVDGNVTLDKILDQLPNFISEIKDVIRHNLSKKETSYEVPDMDMIQYSTDK